MGAKRWDRLTNIYELVERMRCAELGLAQVKLREAETMSQRRRVEMMAAAAVGRAGDGAGDGTGDGAGGGAEWAMAQATREYAWREMKRLAQLREMRGEELTAAEAEHRASRLQLEQIKTVQEAAGTMHRLDEERRTQGSADDRFAAQSWLGVVGGYGR